MEHTVTEAAAELGVSRYTVSRWCRRLGLPRFGTAYRISDANLKRLREAMPGAVGNPEFGSAEMAMRGVQARKKRRRKTKRKPT